MYLKGQLIKFFIYLRNNIAYLKNFSKKLFYFLANLLKLFFGQFIIRFHDEKIIKNFKKSKNKFLKRGWQISNTKEFFNCNFDYKFDISKLNSLKTDKFGNLILREISKEVWIDLLNSKKLVKEITSYLGINARLDDIYIWKKDSSNLSKEDLSCAWHTDNVGHRLKLFIALELSISPPIVQYQKNSQLKKYQISFKEIMRHLKLKIIDEKKDYLSFNIKKNELFIFDTNSKHRDFVPTYLVMIGFV